MIAQLEAQFNEDALMEQFGNIVFEYPEGAVQIGETWSFTIPASSIAPLITENTYTLVAYDDGIATIEVESQVISDPEKAEVDMGYYSMLYNLSGTQEGTIYIDTATGWTLNSTLTQNISGEFILIMDGEETVVPITIVSVAEMEMYEE